MSSDADLDQVRADLLGSLEALAVALLGEPSLRKPRTWRWGNRGSLALELHGRKRGSWHSHETGEGGGPLQLVQHAHSCSMPEAIAWARDWTGTVESRPAEPITAQYAHAREADQADQADRIKAARRLWAASTSLVGTVAERYLTGARGIPLPSGGWPGAVRFHEPSRSLIVAATLADGTVQAVQRVRLTPDGSKVEGTPDAPAKTTNGVLANAAVRLPGDPAGPLVLVEGPETGVSLWAATGHETWVALGSIAKAEPPVGRKVVVARDDDPAWSPADRRLREVVKQWQAASRKVVVATPSRERRGDRSDFNDTMKAGGPEAVRARIEAALAPVGAAVSRKPVGEARRIVGAAVSRFFAAAAEHDPEGASPPPVHAVRVDVGVGKSLAARRSAAEMLARLRSQGDNRTIVFAVPTHKLGEEAAAEFEAMPAARATKLTAQIWRGRNAPDPDVPGEAMCRDLDRVRDAHDAAQSVQSSCCKGKDAKCPFFDACGYQAQRRRRADVWFVAHEMLFTERPSAIGEVAAVIVDEAAWQDGLEGEHGPIVLPLDALDRPDSVPGNALNAQRLSSLRYLAMEALRGAGDGPVQREAMQAIGMTAEGAAEAQGLEWMRKVNPGMHPGMTAPERKAAVRAAEGNRTVRRLAMVWRAVEALLRDDGPQASGWAALAWAETKEGPMRVLHLKGRKPVREGWQVPTLLLDATLNVDLVRPFWPDVQLVADVAAETPHQRIHQVTDRSFSKRHLELHDELADDERRSRIRHLRQLNATLATIGRSYAPGRTLVVTQKAIKEALSTVGVLPPSIELAHHNAVAGRDGWKDVAALVVVGRTAPSPASVQRIAEALTGSAAPLLTGWYPKIATSREMANGAAVAAECDRHPDPICEALRWQICECW